MRAKRAPSPSPLRYVYGASNQQQPHHPFYKVAWSRKIRHEQFCLAAHYALALAILPAPVFAGAVLLSGFMSATIVTVSLGFRDFKPSPNRNPYH